MYFNYLNNEEDVKGMSTAPHTSRTINYFRNLQRTSGPKATKNKKKKHQGQNA